MLLNSIGNLGYQAFIAGEWDRALSEMDAALSEEISARDRLFLMTNALVIRASRGESIDEGVAEIRRVAEAQMSGGWEPFVADPVANAQLASGDLKAAHDTYLTIAGIDLGQAPEYLYRAARCSLWQADAADAATLLTRFDGTGGNGPTFDARRVTIVAGIAAVEGRTAEALALYDHALRAWRDVHGGWDEALTGLDMCFVLDPATPEVAAVIPSTRATLERLGARPFLERLDVAIAGSGIRAQPTAHPKPAPEVVARQ